jgi:hypothetical protein
VAAITAMVGSTFQLNLSVGGTYPSDILEIEGHFTQGSSSGQTVGELVGGVVEMDSSEWSNGIRYHTFGTRPNTEFNVSKHFLWDTLAGLVVSVTKTAQIELKS